MSISDCIWICPHCRKEHDRDTNAATNIKEEGIRLLIMSQPMNFLPQELRSVPVSI
ncbi:zinc ribbon domain-containing protein [Neobacillus sp.]|uniref:zinc ribbon domain-containing protein n=1 Tax=Neobacillus sp. TaxID=2675273 RepID=UPI00289D9993|nr:zinc ribbon domain-containing protein [Neobacillus sp.]